VSLERGPLSLVSTIEEITAVGDRHADHMAPSIRKILQLTSPTIGGRSAGIVRSWTQATEFRFLVYLQRYFRQSLHARGLQSMQCV
jgi:hypothetical protein